MLKNVAGQKWIVFAFNRTTNVPLTGDAANITANLRIDGGGANAVDDTNPTELEDGYYVFDLTAAETNGDYIVICPASATSNIQVIGVPGAVWTTAVGAIADAVWDEVITAAAHAVGDSAALYIRNLYQSLVTRIAQCGDAGTTTTIDLDAAASVVTNFYKGQVIAICGGTGAGQARACISYDGSTKIATVSPTWATNPDGDSWFAVLNVGSAVISSMDTVALGQIFGLLEAWK